MGLGASQSSLLARLRTTMLRMPSSTPTLFPALCISCGLISRKTAKAKATVARPSTAAGRRDQ